MSKCSLSKLTISILAHDIESISHIAEWADTLPLLETLIIEIEPSMAFMCENLIESLFE